MKVWICLCEDVFGYGIEAIAETKQQAQSLVYRKYRELCENPDYRPDRQIDNFWQLSDYYGAWTLCREVGKAYFGDDDEQGVTT